MNKNITELLSHFDGCAFTEFKTFGDNGFNFVFNGVLISFCAFDHWEPGAFEVSLRNKYPDLIEDSDLLFQDHIDTFGDGAGVLDYFSSNDPFMSLLNLEAVRCRSKVKSIEKVLREVFSYE